MFNLSFGNQNSVCKIIDHITIERYLYKSTPKNRLYMLIVKQTKPLFPRLFQLGGQSRYFFLLDGHPFLESCYSGLTLQDLKLYSS